MTYYGRRDWLIKIRKDKIMSQFEVAKSVGISDTYYQLIEYGRRNPSGEVADKIAALLDFPVKNFTELNPL